MDGALEVFGWFLYGVIELRQEILIAFVYVDAPLIFLGLILYMRIRQQRHFAGKEQSIMWGRNGTSEDELFESLFAMAQPALNKAESVLEDLRFARNLPDVDQGKVRRSVDVIAEMEAELRESLKPAVGPPTIRGVAKSVTRMWDAIDKTDDLQQRGSLLRQKHSLTSALAVENFLTSVEALSQIKGGFEFAGHKLRFDPEDFLTEENWGQAATNHVLEAAAVVYRSFADFEGVDHPQLTGQTLLLGTSSNRVDPKLAPPSDVDPAASTQPIRTNGG